MTGIDNGQFATLLHAYGRADDTPAHLAALAERDPAGRSAALNHLWSAVLHQGTPWTATPPAAVAIAGLAGDPRLAGTEDAELRAELIRFLAAVAEAGLVRKDLDELAPPAGFDVNAALAAAFGADDEEAIYGDEILGNAVYGRAIQGCRDVVPTLLTAATTALADPDPGVRAAATHAVGACGKVLDATRQGRLLEQRLDTLAAAAGPDERAALVLAMGDLALEPRAYLDDPHPGVRACAALAPMLADDPAATAELLAALADPAATDTWFAHRPPQLRGRIRFALVQAVLERVHDADRLLPVALAIAPVASPYTVREDWGPLLRALFPAGTTGELSPVQRRYLGALVQNADLWVPGDGTVGLEMRDAGLPYDRDACRRLVEGGALGSPPG
ncbi:hypothetical protein ACFQY4_16845 [Catellatospora bangladeshensis]|uniref:HEAT repeat domain-containing protein n=1 Tax=Catellatospora bangladeshensis TaxID=310355 RepID=A0A8J3NLP3_9ACTN|nr:hypothetical protein [Catellatospora bangladeshensis]GIF84221.1 hypothetical protein Cba03nite_55700 [Catellatospora bangladeshensis]